MKNNAKKMNRAVFSSTKDIADSLRKRKFLQTILLYLSFHKFVNCVFT